MVVNQRKYKRSESITNVPDRSSTRWISDQNSFIRTKWIIHHLKLEEGHQLGCKWCKEHARWNTHLYQLSFAYVMAKRELWLKPETEELTILQQIIQKMMDASEWYPIISTEGTALPVHILN